MIAALTVRKIKAENYDAWRKAWEGNEGDTPEGAEIYILRNTKEPEEIIAVGFVEGDMNEIQASMDPGSEEVRQEAMAPYVESVGTDGIYDVIEHIGARSGASA